MLVLERRTALNIAEGLMKSKHISLSVAWAGLTIATCITGDSMLFFMGGMVVMFYSIIHLLITEL